VWTLAAHGLLFGGFVFLVFGIDSFVRYFILAIPSADPKFARAPSVSFQIDMLSLSFSCLLLCLTYAVGLFCHNHWVASQSRPSLFRTSLSALWFGALALGLSAAHTEPPLWLVVVAPFFLAISTECASQSLLPTHSRCRIAIATLGLAGVVCCLAALFALPFLQSLRNESEALGAMRELTGRQSVYHEQWKRYAESLEQLAIIGPADTPLSPSSIQFGYRFTIVTATADSWAAVAVPVAPLHADSRSFYMDQTGMAHWRLARHGAPSRKDARVGADAPLPEDQ